MTKRSSKTKAFKRGERASRQKWALIERRATELAMNAGKSPEEADERCLRRAKRELLGLQTLRDPDDPLKGFKAHLNL